MGINNLLFVIAFVALGCNVLGFRSNKFLTSFGNEKSRVWRMSNLKMGLADQIGGKILVTGIGNDESDEFMLTLLKDQGIWDKIVLATDNPEAAQKRFLSRTARYSGLLNILEFAELNKTDEDSLLPQVLKDASTWIAFNVSLPSVSKYSTEALNAGVKRAVFSTELPLELYNISIVPEFEEAIENFKNNSASFTGIRHCKLIDGDENNPYDIVNSTVPCRWTCVEKGVLERVMAELLFVRKAQNSYCGLSSAYEFSQKYLDIIRGFGLTRREEVAKVYGGAIENVAYRMVERQNEAVIEYMEKQKQREEELEIERLDEERRTRVTAINQYKLTAKEQLTPEEEEELELEDYDMPVEKLSREQKIEARAEEILSNVWMEYNVRMLTRNTNKQRFLDLNRPKALTLAAKEYEVEKEARIEKIRDRRSKEQILTRIVDANRKQMAKLQALERKEMASQKEISDIWVKYVYLLIETTLEKCETDGTLFHNLDEYAQTLLLRQRANDLRALCGLPPYTVVYDPLDATVIVNKLSVEPLGMGLGLATNDTESIVKDLNAKHGNMLKSIAALRGASQILELAIETLEAELPPPPPTVREMKSNESTARREEVSKMRLQAIRSRNQPKQIGESVVGRL